MEEKEVLLECKKENGGIPESDSLEARVRELKDKNMQLESRVETLEAILKKTEYESCVKENNNDNYMKDKSTEELEKRIAALEMSTQKNPVPSLVADSKLAQRLDNIENVMGYVDVKQQKNLKLKWVLENYEEHFAKGEDVHSPVFHVAVDGYRFQLFVWWDGAEKSTMGLFLRLHRADTTNLDALPPFCRRYTLEVMNRYGDLKSVYISHGSLEKFGDDCFTMHKGEVMTREGFGATRMLCAPYEDFVINDSLLISCVVRPSDANDDVEWRGQGGDAAGAQCALM